MGLLRQGAVAGRLEDGPTQAHLRSWLTQTSVPRLCGPFAYFPLPLSGTSAVECAFMGTEFPIAGGIQAASWPKFGGNLFLAMKWT